MDPLELLKTHRHAKLDVEYFPNPSEYQEWIRKNPWIEVISVIESGSWIVLTYKEAV
jgi:hypothetical protein